MVNKIENEAYVYMIDIILMISLRFGCLGWLTCVIAQYLCKLNKISIRNRYYCLKSIISIFKIDLKNIQKY